MRERPPKDIDRWKRGDVLTARRLNETVDTVNRILPGVRPPRQTFSTPLLSPSGTASGGVIVQQMKIVAVGNNFLECNPYDGLSVDTETSILVAKPYLLRRAPFEDNGRDDLTFTYTDGSTRTASNGSDTEDQVITPSYVAGDVIYAVRGVVGGTDVENTSATDDPPVEWLDMNVDGRSWAKDSTS